MKRWMGLPLIALALAIPGRAWAPPPIGEFPARIAPGDGARAPGNTKLWGFGASLPPLGSVTVALSVDAAPVGVAVEVRGCCAIAATPSAPPPGAASLLVVGARSELRSNFTITSSVDATPPTLLGARVIDDSEARLVLGADGSDDFGLAGFVVRAEGEIRAIGPPGLLLFALPGPDRCADVSALDWAGLESPPRTVCGAARDAGVSDAGGAPDAGGGADAGAGDDGGGCTTTRGGGLGCLAAVALMITRRRARR